MDIERLEQQIKECINRICSIRNVQNSDINIYMPRDIQYSISSQVQALPPNNFDRYMGANVIDGYDNDVIVLIVKGEFLNNQNEVPVIIKLT